MANFKNDGCLALQCDGFGWSCRRLRNIWFNKKNYYKAWCFVWMAGWTFGKNLFFILILDTSNVTRKIIFNWWNIISRRFCSWKIKFSFRSGKNFISTRERWRISRLNNSIERFCNCRHYESRRWFWKTRIVSRIEK